MHSWIRLILVLVLLILASGPVAAKQPVPADLVGSYLWSFQWGGEKITLNADGTFSRASSNCTSVFTESGPYSFSDGLIRFTTTKLTVSGHGSDQVIDLREAKARKEHLDTDEPFEPTESELRVIRWGDRIYLMEQERFRTFVNAINLGFEPRKVDGYREMYGMFYLREGDQAKEAAGNPELPLEFLSLVLKAPVTATITRIDGNTDGRYLVTIDRGSDSGLTIDTTLIPDREDERYFFPYTVVSVTPKSAQVEVFGKLAIGDKLTTRARGLLLN